MYSLFFCSQLLLSFPASSSSSSADLHTHTHKHTHIWHEQEPALSLCKTRKPEQSSLELNQAFLLLLLPLKTPWTATFAGCESPWTLVLYYLPKQILNKMDDAAAGTSWHMRLLQKTQRSAAWQRPAEASSSSCTTRPAVASISRPFQKRVQTRIHRFFLLNKLERRSKQAPTNLENRSYTTNIYDKVISSSCCSCCCFFFVFFDQIEGKCPVCRKIPTSL